jgi:hypothetical protein
MLPRVAGFRTPVQEPVPKTESGIVADATVSLMMGEAAVGGSTGLADPMVGASSSLPQMGVATAAVSADDDTAEELKVVLGHPVLRASGDVSLSEAMGTTHWALNQVHGVLRRERENIDDERRCLLLWASLLKKQTTFEKEKAETKRDWLGMKEELINRK